MNHINKKPLAKNQNPKTLRPQSAPPTEKEPVASPGPDVPYWIPNDDRWKKLPKQLRDTVLQILAPAYRRFVLEAPGELDRSIGLTLVHLTWLEICDQIKMADASADPYSIEAILKNPDDLLERHLRLATIKCHTAELLLKVQTVQNALQRSAATLPSPLLLQGRPTSSPLPLGEGQGEGRVIRNCPSPPSPENTDRLPDLRALFPLPDESEKEPKIGNLNPR
jgi:hypothetical protein